MSREVRNFVPKLQITKTKRMTIKHYLIASALCLTSMQASAQLSTNPDKFLGNITTGYSMDAGGGIPQYYKLWNQVTPENESKWASVQGNRNNFSWNGADNAFNYAKQHKFTYKFHAFLWGAQYPSWLESLSIKDRFDAVETWFDAIYNKYGKNGNTLPLIDVVNEAVGMHQQGNPLIKASVGGGGKTGYDWLIKAFEMAYERFPNSILIYNDFNSIRWDVDNYRTLVQAIRDAGAPIDAYGNQSHDVDDISVNELKNSLKQTQDLLKMPMYITELDINVQDDNKQKAQYEGLLPVMWEADYCAGVTLWGYVYGRTWVDHSGLYKGSTERPAMKWIKEYMATDKAKNAKSPFPGMKKEASVYIKPADYKVAKGDVVAIKVRARMATKTIEKVDLYTGTTMTNATTLVASMTEAPYIAQYTAPSSTGWKILRAVVTTTDGSTYERFGRINVVSSSIKREPYNGTPIELPGTLNIAEFDKGASGVSYSSACYDYSKRATISATKDNGWMEYTVDVKEDGLYRIDAEVASKVSGGTFHLTEYGLDSLTFLANMIEVPITGSTTEFQTVTAICKNPISAGQHRICLNVDKGGFYIKSLKFSRYENDENNTITCTVSKTPATINMGQKSTITVKATSKTSTIAKVDLYANDLLIATLTEAPYTFEYEPVTYGKFVINALATDVEGKTKKSGNTTLTVNPKREPYSGVIELPGTLEAENYDIGGEGYSFHDTSTANEGDANFRTDEAVDIVKGNNGKAIGYTDADEWMEYTVNVKEDGKYALDAVVSSGTTDSYFIVQRMNGTAKTTLFTVYVPQTGNNNWDTYKTVTAPVSKSNSTMKEVTLNAGEQVFRITIKGKQCNIDKLIFKCTQSTGINEIGNDEQTGASYSLSGQKVDNGYRGIVIRNGKKVIKK